MPHGHARFIEHVTEHANIRSFVLSQQSNFELRTAYDATVASLTEFRSKHIQLIARYIVVPSKLASTGCLKSTESLLRASSGSVFQASPSQTLVGTGGTQLVPFLRQARDETAAASIR